MGQLSGQSDAATNAAGAAELAAASAAIQAQDGGHAGSRSDSSAVQIPSRGLEFNPANEAAGASGVAETGASQGAASTGAQPAGAASGVQSEYTDALDYARGRGLDVSGFPDSSALMEALVNTYHGRQQANVYEQLGRQLAPQAGQIQQYLQTQQQPQQPAGVPEWEAPPFDPRWAGMVEQHPQTGVYIGKHPSVPQEIVAAVNKYADWQSKYGSNPIAAVRPYVEQTVPQMIEQAVSARLQQFQSQQEVQQIIARNSEWMYQQDANGRTVMGVGGRPVVTPQGQRYSQHVQQLEAAGMRNPSQIDQYARQLVMAELHAAQAAQHQAGNPPPAQQRAAIASSRPQTNVLQSLLPEQRATTPGVTDADQSGLSLHERIARDLAAAGFTDADFQDLDSMR